MLTCGLLLEGDRATFPGRRGFRRYSPFLLGRFRTTFRPNREMEVSPPKTPVETLEKSAICANVIELPRRYEVCDVEHIILLVSDLITETMAINDIARYREAGMTLFHSL